MRSCMGLLLATLAAVLLMMLAGPQSASAGRALQERRAGVLAGSMTGGSTGGQGSLIGAAARSLLDTDDDKDGDDEDKTGDDEDEDKTLEETVDDDDDDDDDNDDDDDGDDDDDIVQVDDETDDATVEEVEVETVDDATADDATADDATADDADDATAVDADAPTAGDATDDDAAADDAAAGDADDATAGDATDDDMTEEEGCKLELQIAYKSADEDAAREMCEQAATYLSINISWGEEADNPVGIEFECYNASGMTVLEGVPWAPTWGGIHAFNDFYGILSIRPVDQNVTTLELEEFYAALDFSGGLGLLAKEIDYPKDWRSTCCSDPIFVMTDRCEVGSTIFGEWATGCQSCNKDDTETEEDDS